MKTVRHRFAVWLIAPLLFSVSIEAQESNRPVVAVFDITLDGLFMTDEAVSRITDVLASSLLKGRQYLVVPREQITKALIEQKLESHKDCYESCQINLLGALAANRLLSSRVTAIENQCTLTIDLYDAASQTLERSEIVRLTDCSESALMVGIGVACDRIGSDTATNKANPTGNSTGSDRPASLQTGYLAINGTPKAAKVLINGPKEFGNNGTFEGVLPVPPLLAPVGEYEVTVSAIDYDSESKSVVVTSDATTTGTFDLIKSLGRVIISELPPFAEFTLECSGSTTHKGTLSGSPAAFDARRGKCSIHIAARGFEAFDETFEVSGGRETTVMAKLRPDLNTGIQWIKIKGGQFEMGSNDAEGSERPVHTVTIDSYEIAKTEVTVEQYGRCVLAGACSQPGTGLICNWGVPKKANHPINCVTWAQADTFSKWAGGRLPTEAEWEYAAKSGGRNHLFPWGNDKATCKHAVMDDGSGPGCGTGDSTWPICSKIDGNTEQGLCDMAGNVWELVSDWYGNYRRGAQVNPSGRRMGDWGHVIRGASFRHGPDSMRTTSRSTNTMPHEKESVGSFTCGFRPVRPMLNAILR